VLNAEWFATTAQAQIVINQWLRQYNHGCCHGNAPAQLMPYAINVR